MGLEKINDMRKLKGISIDELCEKSGVPKGTLSKITAGITKNPSIDTVKSIVHAMGYTLDDLDDFPNLKKCTNYTIKETNLIEKYRVIDEHGKDMVDTVLNKEYERYQKENNPKETSKTVPFTPEIETTELIYSSYKASAGTGYFLFDDAQEERVKVVYNDLTRKADICIGVSGNSMEPKFYNDDILLVRQQPAVENGEIGIFILDNKGYVKMKGENELLSLNHEYPNIPKSNGIICWGKVLGKLEKDWIK